MKRSSRPDHAAPRPREAAARQGALRAAATTVLMLLMCLVVAAAAAGVAGAATKPAKPVAKAPKGTITTATPTFSWGKAKGATKYEVRVYQGSKLVVKKTGLTKTSWKTTKAMPTAALTWKVRGSNAAGAGPWSSSAAFTVTSPTAAKSITAFSFQSLDPAVVGSINQTAHTIALTVPYGTDVKNLVATFTTTGASVAVGSTAQVSGVTANDFTSPVTYTVTAVDSTTQDYVVTVTVMSPSTTKTITAFSFQALNPAVIGAVDQSAHTIALTVPAGTSVKNLVATFTTTGQSVKVGSAAQTSGSTANDFTNPVTYTVTAQDASTQDYVVTVTVQTVHVGDAFGGGIVAYIYQSGDPGYVAGETHGLIVSSGDVSGLGIQWWNGSYVTTGATGTGLGTGSANTDAIISAQGATATSYAAGLARAYTGGGHSDWYLPSKDELNKVYVNKATIGGSFDSLVYWTSSEASGVSAYSQNFTNGHAAGEVKQDLQGVRAVRSF